jgi:hypothetical protein
MILREGDLVISRRFVLRQHATEWGDEQRTLTERGIDA